MKFKLKKINDTILSCACKSGNIELVKYLISLEKIDINSKNVVLFIFFNYVYSIILMMLIFYIQHVYLEMLNLLSIYLH